MSNVIYIENLKIAGILHEIARELEDGADLLSGGVQVAVERNSDGYTISLQSDMRIRLERFSIK